MHKRLPLFFICFVLILLVGCQQVNNSDNGDSDGSSETRGTVRPDPIPVTFATLNADPFTFLNRVVRVTGVFRTATPVGCFPFTGPETNWRMVADGFNLPVNGLGVVNEVAPEGLVITIDGVWRKYDGPFGCGEEPEESTFWYLEASQLVSPNPLGGGGGSEVVQNPSNPPAATAETGGTIPTNTPTAGSTIPTPTSFPTSTATQIATITPVPTFTPAAGETATATATSVNGGSTATPSSTGTTQATPGPTSTGTITVTPTPGQGNSLTPEPTSSVGESGSGTRTAATPEATSTSAGGYPSPSTNTPTPTPGSYP